VGTLRVCDEGLNALAEQCVTTATQVADRVPAPAAGPPTQATAVAVSSAYAALAETATVLATRIETAAGKLTASASHYVATDEASSQQLSGLVGGAGRE